MVLYHLVRTDRGPGRDGEGGGSRVGRDGESQGKRDVRAAFGALLGGLPKEILERVIPTQRAVMLDGCRGA